LRENIPDSDKGLIVLPPFSPRIEKARPGIVPGRAEYTFCSPWYHPDWKWTAHHTGAGFPLDRHGVV